MSIAWLEATTWHGLSIDAEHWYGQLVCDENKVQLTRIIASEAEALYLNKKAGYGARYRLGGITRGFVSIEDLRENAVRCFQGHFPNATLLIEGKDRLYPGLCLFGPPDVQNAAQVLYERMEAQYRGRREPRSWAEHDNILDEWEALIAPYKG